MSLRSAWSARRPRLARVTQWNLVSRKKKKAKRDCRVKIENQTCYVWGQTTSPAHRTWREGGQEFKSPYWVQDWLGLRKTNLTALSKTSWAQKSKMPRFLSSVQSSYKFNIKWLRVEIMRMETGPWEQKMKSQGSGELIPEHVWCESRKRVIYEEGIPKRKTAELGRTMGRAVSKENIQTINKEKVNCLLHEFLNANFKCIWLFYYAKLQCNKAHCGTAESLLLQEDTIRCMRNHLRTPFLFFRCFCLLFICFRRTWVIFTGMLSAFSYPTSSLWLFPYLLSNGDPSAFHVDIRQSGVFKWEDTTASAFLCLVYFT